MKTFLLISVSLLILSGCAYTGHRTFTLSGDDLVTPYGTGSTQVTYEKSWTFLWFWNKPKG